MQQQRTTVAAWWRFPINKTNAAVASLKDVMCWGPPVCEGEIKSKAGLTKPASVCAQNEFIWEPAAQQRTLSVPLLG